MYYLLSFLPLLLFWLCVWSAARYVGPTTDFRGLLLSLFPSPSLLALWDNERYVAPATGFWVEVEF